VDADAVELRVLGCLIEKQRTTPDVYPLSLNALRLACNQATNRDPVVDYGEPELRGALERLARRGWTRLASGPGSRVAKYRHRLDPFSSLDDVHGVLERLLERELAVRLPRRPGQKEERYAHLLGGEAPAA